MLYFLSLLLIIFFINKTNAECHQDDAYNEYYHRGRIYYNGYNQRNDIPKEEILCTNLSSIQDIFYSFQTGSYEQNLVIAGSNITTINPSELAQFSTINKLFLNGQHVENILPGAFTGLVSLQELHLNDNNLTKILNGVFNSLHSLILLNLKNNKIRRIETFAFMGMSNLKQLYLNRNNISVIDNGTFEKLHMLTNLDVSHNPLKQFPFGDLSEINELQLSKTELNGIDHDLSNLSMNLFNLSYCHLSTLDFAYFPQVKNLFLSHNQILVLENCQKLNATNVRLDYNKIKNTDESFNSIRLDLSHNEIGILKTLKPNSEILDFSYNNISKLESCVFCNLTSLQQLNLRHNIISKINPNLFRDLQNLEALDLSQNQIEEFSYGLFDSLISLVSLNISNNKLIQLNYLHFLPNLRNLYFDNNLITAFDSKELVQHLPKLALISFNSNPLSCKELVAVVHYLQTNKITIIEGYSYDLENVRGVACTKSNTSSPSVQNFIQNFENSLKSISFKGMIQNLQKSVSDSLEKMKILTDFNNSNFVQYFEKGFTQSNFFKYLENHKFITYNLNGSKSEKLIAQPTREVADNKVFVVSLIIQIVMLLALMFIIYLRLSSKNVAHKKIEMSQLELC
ncbi:leucine-rich repeat-containing protein egg-6-like [Tribolium castaneum]|uniref:leucine-rich repeat-containing protein egg-6-like n=1 Tax=Tribolium castaneum TaxID=7070 RepID=UPI00046C0A6F|nr:PREDICTED: leucine-rich repeat-containing protein egg-6-like [Tribolium castaneum]|eukprot:XP_008199908.1 PREDICTED: leucine-rich repeat-containing protein egg-6-like [Tribolium castaneum]